MTNKSAWFAAALWLAACGSSIEPDQDDDREESVGDGADGDGTEVLIDATADGTWVYFDLGNGKVVERWWVGRMQKR